MNLQTSRFGEVEVDQAKRITFPEGLLGFPNHHDYVLLQPSEDNSFFWLQSMDDAGLAFVVTDPGLFLRDYEVTVRPEQRSAIGLDRSEDLQVLVIVNRRGDVISGNLQGPLAIHAERRIGLQLVLADKRYDTRQELMRVGGKVAASA